MTASPGVLSVAAVHPVAKLSSRQRCTAAARLIQRMLPDADALAFFDGDGRLLALSEDCTSDTLLELMGVALDAGGPIRASRTRDRDYDRDGTSLAGRVYALPWSTRDVRLSGVLALQCAPADRTELPLLEDLETTLRPVLRQLAATDTRAETTLLGAPEYERIRNLLRALRVHLGADVAALELSVSDSPIVDAAATLEPRSVRALLDPDMPAARLTRSLQLPQRRLARLTLVRARAAHVFTDLDADAFSVLVRELERPAPAEATLAQRSVSSELFLALTRATWESQRGCGGAMLVITLENYAALGESLGEAAAVAAFEWTLRRLTPPTLPEGALIAMLDATRLVAHVPGCHGADACELARRVRRALAGLKLGYPPIALEFSIGLADGASHVSMNEALDQARYDADTTTVVFEAPFVTPRIEPSVRIDATRVREILALERLRLHAQPIESAAPSNRSRFEILLRVEAAGGQIEAPAELLRAAGEAGRLAEVDRWVLQRTVESLRHWRRGLHHLPLQVCINLSEASIEDPQFAKFVESTIVGSDVPAGWLCFEAADRHVATHGDALARLFRVLRDLGCGRTLDDFDCDSRGLALRGDLPISTLAVDAALVGACVPDVRAILRRALDRGLVIERGIEVRAKRIESTEERARMRLAGIELLQGYAVGRPRPLRALLSDLTHA
jgi:EAL domain-containing protein (putative c-di-GMP-specific phosphodiesterase class I)